MRKFSCLIVALLIVWFDIHAQLLNLLKDIMPGGGASIYAPIMGERLAINNNAVFFEANDGVHGYELWKTNGTASGTVLVKDIRLGSTGSGPQNFVDVNGVIFFAADDGVHGRELWKTDGTEAGTVIVKDIIPGSANGVPGQGETMVNADGVLYFWASNGVHGYELWKTDGTEAGTVMVKDIRSGASNSGGSGDPLNTRIAINGILYFLANDGVHGEELWKSDGTQTGTVLLKDILPGGGNSGASKLINSNGTLFFFANDGISGSELWKSDGSAAGTVMVKDIYPGAGSNNATGMTSVNGIIFLAADDGVHGNELWKSDGTETGTVLVKDIYPGGNGGPSIVRNTWNTTFFYGIVNGTVLFFANDPLNGRALWRTDGTEAGTTLVKDIFPGMTGGAHGNCAVANNQLFFYVNDGSGTGDNLWRSDGTEQGTVHLPQNTTNIPNGSAPATLHWLLPIGSKLVTDVVNATSGREFWAGELNLTSPLPLTLVDIKGQLAGNDGLLQWKTSSEQNTSHFEIERSSDGRNFIKTGTVTAAGNSFATKQYNYTDRNITSLGAAVVYYRLKMTDADSKFTFSKIIAININSREAVVMLYPNPVQESATLMIAAVKKESITYRIIDQHGRTVQQRNVNLNEGSNMITLETAALTPGVYNIILRSEKITKALKFVKE